jgi:YidC/Oxa1 family membrane protein insertase
MFQTLLIKPLFNALLGLYAVVPGHDFGLAIILFTLLVRVLLWPLVRKQLHSQRAMQKLAPEIAKIKAKSAGDRTKESQMLMEMYKERGISPLASLVPLFVQLPVLFAFFFVIQHALKVAEINNLGYDWLKQLDYIKAI